MKFLPVFFCLLIPFLSVFARDKNERIHLSQIRSLDSIVGECSEQLMFGNWKFTTYLDLTGKSGNSDEFGTQFGFSLKKEILDSSSKIYASYDRAKQESIKTSDEKKLGASFTGYLFDKFGIYLSIDGEEDDFEGLNLRLVPSVGFAYRFLFVEDHKLTGKLGASYRYEDFKDNSVNKAWGLNLSLEHYWKFAEWGKMTNELTFTPSIEETDEFLLEQDSGINIPLGKTDKWSLRFGLSNHYNNVPLEGLKELDTAYYTRILVDFD